MTITPLTLAVKPGSLGWDTTAIKPRLGDGFDTSREDVARQLYHELGIVARFHSIAIAHRGRQDQAHAHHATWRRVWESTPLPVGMTATTVELFFDVPAMWHNATPPGERTFDFARADHWNLAWENFFVAGLSSFDERTPTSPVNPLKWTRLPDGRVPITLWSIVPGTHPDWRDGAGTPTFINQEMCGTFLREMARRIENRFGFTPAWSVDVSWQVYDPSGPYWGVNRWFEPPTQNYSITEHAGVKVGIVAAGFRDPAHAPEPRRVMGRRDGKALQEGLAACIAAGCQKIYVEGVTGWEEETLILETEAWGTRELETVRAARFVADGGNVTHEEILTTSLLETAPGKRDHAYNMIVNHGRYKVLEAIAAELKRKNGAEPDEGLVFHNFFRAMEVWPTSAGNWWPWATLRDAIWDRRTAAPIVQHPDPEPEPEEDTVKIVVHEDKQGVAFEYQNVVRFVKKGDVAGLEGVFAFDADGGDVLNWQRSSQTEADWEYLVRRMLRRAA